MLKSVLNLNRPPIPKFLQKFLAFFVFVLKFDDNNAGEKPFMSSSRVKGLWLKIQFFKIIIYLFLDHFDMMVLKINFKKYYFYIFINKKKHDEKQYC
jgi:hypothetical protein